MGIRHEIANQGDGATPDVRGTFEVNERYARLDIVVCGGAAFIGKYDDPGICPGEGWQMMSRQGKPGRPGAPGERGPRGKKGDTGPPPAQFIGAKVNENYELVSVLSYSTKEIMPLRPAFERYHNESGRE